MAEKSIAIIKNWSQRNGYLYGEVYGHPDFPDGTTLSSTIVDVVKDAEDTYIVETLEMFYALVPPADVNRPFRFKENNK